MNTTSILFRICAEFFIQKGSFVAILVEGRTGRIRRTNRILLLPYIHIMTSK